MHSFAAFEHAMRQVNLSDVGSHMRKLAEAVLAERPHGDEECWQAAWQSVAGMSVLETVLDADAPKAVMDHSIQKTETISAAMKALHPWRKGPFQIGDIYLDAEWRSDWKWQRIVSGISTLSGRRVLDVGSGNGYYLYRMLGAGAQLAVGVDPTRLFLNQFAFLQQFFSEPAAFLLPLKDEEIPTELISSTEGFDTVFSMGVLYHRRDPHEHLQRLKACLRPGGELVLETLIIPGQKGMELIPSGRYAQMRNVWSLPDIVHLQKTVSDAGFEEIEIIDRATTSIDEQRKTQWMQFDSLDSFLNPEDHSLTVEGHPAPLRATLKATKPV